MATVTRITFEDHGQDFLRWDIAETGEVRNCKPMQGWLWDGRKVLNLDQLKVGGFAVVSCNEAGRRRMQLRYRIESIEKGVNVR